MHLPITSAARVLSPIILLTSLAAAEFDCSKVVVDDAEFHLKKLSGLHEVSWLREASVPNNSLNTTFKIDICAALKFEKGQDSLRRGCGEGTRICGVEEETFGDIDSTEVIKYVPIARSYAHDGAALEPHRTRLKTAESNADSQKEGLRLQLGGGKVEKRDQKAIIELLCRRDDGKTRQRRSLDSREDDEDKSKPEWEAAKKADDGAGGEIEFLSYEEDTLRLEWRTPYGCEDAKDAPKDEDGSSGGGGWGFFSWFFFLGFIGLLLYFGFSAWINYTRYGAQGWDLIPHSDTIRDIPYILGDFWRKIVGTVGGGGSRGGYSAV